MSTRSNMNDPMKAPGLALLACLSLCAGTSSLAGEVTPRLTGAVSIAELRTLLRQDMVFQIFEFEAEDDFCLFTQVFHQVDRHPQEEQPAVGECWTGGPMSLTFKIEQAEGGQRITFGLYHREFGDGGSFTLRPLPILDIVGRGFGWQTPDTTVPGNQRLLELQLTERDPEAPEKRRRHDIQVDVRFEPNPDGKRGTASSH